MWGRHSGRQARCLERAFFAGSRLAARVENRGEEAPSARGPGRGPSVPPQYGCLPGPTPNPNTFDTFDTFGTAVPKPRPPLRRTAKQNLQSQSHIRTPMQAQAATNRNPISE